MKFTLKEITTLETKPYAGNVYDLTVANDESYNIEGVIVHNSACTTRIKTGIGVPQLTAIMNCSRVGVPLIADGGLRTPGDVCKAIAAGATMVMIGGMLAGTDETPGEVIEKPTGRESDLAGNPELEYYKSFRGMASKEAVEDFFGTMNDWKTAEGVSTLVPCKGSVENVIKDIMGGLRSCMTYVGANNLTDLQKRVTFVRITNAGREESKAHIENVVVF